MNQTSGSIEQINESAELVVDETNTSIVFDDEAARAAFQEESLDLSRGLRETCDAFVHTDTPKIFFLHDKRYGMHMTITDYLEDFPLSSLAELHAFTGDLLEKAKEIKSKTN